MKDLKRVKLDLLAKVMPVISEIEQKSYIGGGDGTEFSPYTSIEMDIMISSGKWKGGFVDGLGYVGPNTNVYAGSGDYYTLSEYFQKNVSSGWDQVASSLLGTGFGYWEQEFSDMWQEMGIKVMEKGYGATAQFFVRSTDQGSTRRIEIVDYQTGSVIISGAIGVSGYYTIG